MTPRWTDLSFRPSMISPIRLATCEGPMRAAMSPRSSPVKPRPWKSGTTWAEMEEKTTPFRARTAAK